MAASAAPAGPPVSSDQAPRPLRPDQISLDYLLASSPCIAVIQIDDAPPLQREDDALTIKKQRADACLITPIRGELPATFLLENESQSVLTPGRKLAFLQKLTPGHYILSTPVSLRRIDGDKVHWFRTTSGPTYQPPLADIVQQLTSAYGQTPPSASSDNATLSPPPPSAPKTLRAGQYRGYAETFTIRDGLLTTPHRDGLLTTPHRDGTETEITLQASRFSLTIGNDFYRYYDRDRLLAIRHLPSDHTERLQVRAQCGPVTVIDLTTHDANNMPVQLTRLTVGPDEPPK